MGQSAQGQGCQGTKSHSKLQVSFSNTIYSCPSLRREIVVVLLLWLIRFCPSALRYDSQLRESSNALGDMQGLESLKMEWSLGM